MKGHWVSDKSRIHITLHQWFLSGGKFAPPPGDVGQYLEIFLVVTAGRGGGPGVQRVEARDAAKPPTMHRTVPHKELSG